jgi:4-amino-4-deoxy-L-arabinose transferase-like glycosyltransferase
VFHRITRSPYGTLLLGLLTLLVIGVTFLTDYGASIDEWHNSFYGRLFLQQYETGSLLRSPGIDYFNGPFYFMLFTITSRLFRLLNPGWLLTDGLHLTNYLTFLVGVFIFYRLSLRMLPRNAALFATALFTTQPVLFGHAFINQKDTPLMVFFLAAVESGLTAVESRLSPVQAPSGVGDGRPKRRAAEEWRHLPAGIRVAVVTGALAGVILLMDLWWIGSLRLGARTLLTQIYAGQGPAFLVALFGRIAEDAHKTP